MTFSETANKVVALARKARDYYAAELPKRHRHYPLVGAGEEEPPAPPEEKQLHDFLASLPDEIVYRLILVMYLGRGDVTGEDLGAEYEGLKETVGDADDAVAYMMIYTATLADELSDGLEELRKQKINLDKMPLKKVKARKR